MDVVKPSHQREFAGWCRDEDTIDLEGKSCGRRRFLRVCREMKPKLRRKHKRRRPARVREPLKQANKSYSMDFMSDALGGGRRLRILNIMNDYTRESLATWCDYSIPGKKVVH